MSLSPAGIIPPSDAEQLLFLSRVQRLLDSGRFTATYKFALFLALAELAVERGDDSGAALRLSLDDIASRFLSLYWRQATPFFTNDAGSVLQQNTGHQAAIVTLVSNAYQTLGKHLGRAKHQPGWSQVVSQARSIVVDQPLTKLQTIGNGKKAFVDRFLYDNEGIEELVELLPGVAFCLRRFFPMLQGLVQSKWLGWVQAQNSSKLGAIKDLESFMFGASRGDVRELTESLWHLQEGRCFYRPWVAIDKATAHIDHFIPWASYPCDVVANLVLASPKANSAKKDHLAAARLLERWCDRNRTHGDALSQIADEHGVENGQATMPRVAEWAYASHEAMAGLVWNGAGPLIPLDPGWRNILRA